MRPGPLTYSNDQGPYTRHHRHLTHHQRTRSLTQTKADGTVHRRMVAHRSIPAHKSTLCGHANELVGTFRTRPSKVRRADETIGAGEQRGPLDTNSRGEDLVGRWNCLS